MKLKYKTCKWNHLLEDAYQYNDIRYCRTCKKARSSYEWYLIKCKDSKVIDGIITWNQWAKDLWGGPYLREML